MKFLKKFKIKDIPGFLQVCILYFIWGSLGLAIAFATYWEQWMVLAIALVTLGLTFLPYTLEYYDIKLPRSFSIAIIFFLYATLFLGEVKGFYDKFWWWDLVLHTGSAMGFGFIGFLLLYILIRREKVQAQPVTLAIFSFAFAVAIGVLWEIIEFSSDHFFGTNMQRSGLNDTMGDLIVDCVGAFLASLAGFFYLKGIWRNFFFGRWLREFRRENKHFFMKKRAKNA